MTAAVDRWNLWYVKMRADLVTRYGVAGTSDSTKAPLPALPYSIAVALCARVAAKVAEVFIERAKKEAPGYSVTGDYSTVFELVRRTRVNMSDNPINDHQFTQEFWQEFGDSAKAFVEARPSKQSDAGTYTDLALGQFIDVPEILRDATTRTIRTSNFIGVVRLNSKLEHTAHMYLNDTIRVYEELVRMPRQIANLLKPGETVPNGKLNAAGAALMFKFIYRATTQISLESTIVDIDFGDALVVAGKAIKDAAEVAIKTGADAVGATAGWIAEQTGKAIGGAASNFLDEVGMYGIALVAIFAYATLR